MSKKILREAERRVRFFEARLSALLSAYEKNVGGEILRKLKSSDDIAVIGGFGTFSEESMRVLLEEVAALFGEMFQDTLLDLPSDAIRQVDKAVLENYIYEKLKEYRNLLMLQVSRARSQVLEGALAGESLFLPDIKLSGGLEDAVMNGLMIFSRAIVTSALEDDALVMYVGPRDEKNRPFCAERAGNIYTMKEVLSWDNGQGLPAAVYCGGYNCRHFLYPLGNGGKA